MEQNEKKKLPIFWHKGSEKRCFHNKSTRFCVLHKNGKRILDKKLVAILWGAWYYLRNKCFA